MELFLESPTAVGAIGLLLVTTAGIVFSQSRSHGALAALLLAVLLTVSAVVAERLYLTPREQALAVIDELFAAVEANDLAAVLAVIDAGAIDMRADAEALMPQFTVESAGQGGEVTLEMPADASSDGAIATARLKPLIRVVHRKTGAAGAYFDGLQLELVRRGGEWKLVDYEPAKDWRDGAARLGR